MRYIYTISSQSHLPFEVFAHQQVHVSLAPLASSLYNVWLHRMLLQRKRRYSN